MLTVRIRDEKSSVDDYLPYLGVLNSTLFGYLFFQLSAQWGKGEGKRDTLRNLDVENLPFKKIPKGSLKDSIASLVQNIHVKKSQGRTCEKELEELNEAVFDLYGLLDYEKEIIREFYDVRVKRAGARQSLVRVGDIEAYSNAFVDAFSLILAEGKTLNVSYRISPNLGTAICFSIVDDEQKVELVKDHNLNLLHLVKSQQIGSAESMNILFEGKVKLYDKERLYIIKSNQFKDWTVRQAIKDAKEEVDAFLNMLPE